MRRATIDQLSFSLRASGLRLRRSLRDLSERPQRLTQATERDQLDQHWPAIQGQSTTPLWTGGTAQEWSLTAGKVQNLRQAVCSLHGLVIPAGEVFSFWRHVARPTRRRGYVAGRELREGCMVASIGGGLCQLSNALYAAALDAGCEIVERHKHSRVIPGSLAESDRDATIFWNYVDLRFRAATDLVIEARLTASELALTLRGKATPAAASNVIPEATCAQAHQISRLTPGDCLTCGETSCVYVIRPRDTAGLTAFLLDEIWPEFDRWQQEKRGPRDTFYLPLDGKKWERSGYAWTLPASGPTVTAPWLTWREGRRIRDAGHQGAGLQQALLARDAALAGFYHRRLPAEADRLVISLNLLPHLWRLGALGGRRFTVLMTRAPLGQLQQILDAAAALHPDSPTLGDYRAPAWLMAAEEAALAAADRLVTPHAAIADQLRARFSGRVDELAWVLPGSATAIPPAPPRSNRPAKVLFAASGLARKGAYEMRDAARHLPISLRVLGRAAETADFWHGLEIDRPAPGSDPLSAVDCVVLPAFVEQQPRLLLRALARGIPVICTPACGLGDKLGGDRSGIRQVPVGDAAALALAIHQSTTKDYPKNDNQPAGGYLQAMPVG